MTNINTKFITNESGENLQKRFATLIKNTRFFDVLSGYFYSSGFKAIYPSLENCIPKYELAPAFCALLIVT